jgi:transposase
MPRRRTVNRIHELAAQGKSIHTLTTTLGIARSTVRKYLWDAAPPKALPKRPSTLDPFTEQIRRWLAQDHLYNCETMLPRLQALGYTGGLSILKDFVHSLRPARVGHRPVRRYEIAPARNCSSTGPSSPMWPRVCAASCLALPPS